MSSSRNRKVTSFDVARRAGVSRAAVSRTFTPDASVSPETRAKVQKAALELGYRVNYLARGLTNQRSDLVGVVAAGMDNPFRFQQIDQLVRALLRSNFRPVLLPVDDDAGTIQVIEQLLHYSVSGVIVTSDAPPSFLCEECAAAGAPIILINKGTDIPFVDRVMCDNETAGRLAADTLVEAGARRLAVMAASAVSYTAQRRREAFLRRAEELGVQATVIAVALNDYRNGLTAAGQVMDIAIDGLFCVNDYLACGVIDGIGRKAGSKLPEELKLIGLDDIPQAAWEAYSLTTIRQPCDIQAEQAVQLLISRIALPHIPARIEFTPVSLVRRKTA
jgi:LacI family transcriptional regulator